MFKKVGQLVGSCIMFTTFLFWRLKELIKEHGALFWVIVINLILVILLLIPVDLEQFFQDDR